MKNIKKILFLLILVLGLTVLACGEKEDSKTPTPEDPTDGPQKDENGFIIADTNHTDSLKLESSYDNLSFLNDGIGEVSLTQCVDGDTAHFRDLKSGKNFTARFLCINTPESTGRIDPWGKAASSFVASKLKAATKLVCESKVNGSPAEVDSTQQRYLAYVWYKTSENSEFRLLNLELVEHGYTKFTDVPDKVKYGDVFQTAHLESYALKIKDYGELDPDFDYSGEVKEVTIAEIMKNFDSYSGGTKLHITARVMRLVGDNMYLQDLEQTEFEEDGNVEYKYGSIYMFSGYGSGLGKLVPGTVISLDCQCTENETYGKQLTSPQNVRRMSTGEEYNIIEIENPKASELGDYEGFVVLIKGLKVKDMYTPNDEGAFTIFCEAANGEKINVRVDGDAQPKFKHSEIEVGKTYDVIGGISKYNDSYQLMLANCKGEAVNDFKLSE